jgi:hypothetical protein
MALMALPLIPIILGAGTAVRMVAPKVAEMLIKSGAAKKASKAAVDKVKGTPTRLSSKDAEKIVARSKPFVQDKAGAARPVPKSEIQKKMDKATTGNDVATQGSRAVATQGSRAVATQGSRAVATQGSRAVATQGSRAVAKRPSGTVAKRPSGDDKGKIVGLSNKGKAAAAASTAAGIASLVDSEKKTDKPLSKLPTKTVAKRKEPVPVKEPRSTIKDVKKKPEPPKAEVQGPENKPLKPLEGGVRYIDNPFGKGKIKVDSSDAAFNMEPEFSGDYKGGKPGMKKNVVKRKAGGKIGRGCGAAMRGGGKVMR